MKKRLAKKIWKRFYLYPKIAILQAADKLKIPTYKLWIVLQIRSFLKSEFTVKELHRYNPQYMCLENTEYLTPKEIQEIDPLDDIDFIIKGIQAGADAMFLAI